MNCDSEANIPVSQIMVEMVDVASFHTTETRAESHRQNVVVPIRQIQDDMVTVIQLIHKCGYIEVFAGLPKLFLDRGRVRTSRFMKN